MAVAATGGMADAQRIFERRVDELVLSASPSELAVLQEIDAYARASGMSFYDAYLTRAGGGGTSRAPAAGAPPGASRRARRAARGGRSPRASEAAAP